MPLRRPAIALLLLAIVAAASQSRAQPQDAQTGSIEGQVADAATAAPLEGVRVILVWPAPADDSEPREEVAQTDAEGRFEFASVPVGSYSLEFIKPGYGTATLKNFQVHAGEPNRADQRMAEGSDALEPAPDVEEILVLGARLQAIEASRQESDEMINALTAEDLSKFAASDVADVILRIPGVNVVEGQFAIIRGLEDRYSSTLYNSAPIPSPDPDRQSPQLDLFPSEIVSDLVVTKTFGPDLPSNSSGGSINVLTASYPEEQVEVGFKAKGGWNDNAIDRFLSLEDNSPVGDERDAWNTVEQEYGGTLAGRSTLLGRELRYRFLGNWGVDYDSAFGFKEGREPRTNSAARPDGDLERGELSLTTGHFDLTNSEREEQTTGFGAFGFDFDEAGNHGVDLSLFWTQKGDEVVQLEENGYLPGYDYLKPGGPVELENAGSTVYPDTFLGTLPGGLEGNAALSSWIIEVRDSTTDQPGKAPLWLSSFIESKSFQRDRDLMVPQINGRHEFDLLPGFQLSWVGNWARTTQSEDAIGARMWYEPCGYSGEPQLACPPGVARIPVPTTFPVTVESLGPGTFVASNDLFINDNDIDEEQWFGRLDGEYARDLSDWLAVALRSGGWYEYATRDIDSSFLEQRNAVLNTAGCRFPVCNADPSFPAIYGDTLKDLGSTLGGIAFVRDGSVADATRKTQSEAKREIQALGLGSKTTLWEDLDLLGGVRVENIFIESINDPFVVNPATGGLRTDIDNAPLIYPTKYLFFDRFGDNPRREFPRNPPFNDQVLGLRVREGPCRSSNLPGQDPTGPVLPGPCVDLVNRAEIEQFVNGEIDELKYLPSVGLTYRPIEGLALRAAWSQTVARPSFRELGYYVSVEPASDDLIVGNPQLQLSDVESWDARVEYFYGDYGDLVAVSSFYKTIDDPIESIIVRDPSDFLDTLSTALYRTYFNNPNEATLWGVELEARKNFGFLREAAELELWGLGGRLGFLDQELFDYLSIGSNFTWIEAEVDRTEAELARSARFFPGGSGKTLDESRRLYGQPEWMVNADVSFDHPDWGTRLTLAFYAISDVLDAAGAATIGRSGEVEALTLDRYVDSFHTLDLTLRQALWNGLAVKLSAKNLTDSRREIVYDPAATSGKFTERSYHVGRDYSFELSYTFSELPFLPGD